MSKKYKVVNLGTGEEPVYLDILEFDTLDELNEMNLMTIFGCVAIDGESYMDDSDFEYEKENGTLFTSIENGLREVDEYGETFGLGDSPQSLKEYEDGKATFLKEIGDAKEGFVWGMEYDCELVVVITGNFFELREEAKKKKDQLEKSGYYV